MMALVALVPFALISCGSDSDNGGGSAPSPTLPAGKTAAAVKKITGITGVGGLDASEFPEVIEFGPDGKVLIHFSPDKVTADGKGKSAPYDKMVLPSGTSSKARKAPALQPFEYYYGSYTVTGTTYNMGKIITLVIKSEKGSEYTFDVSFPGLTTDKVYELIGKIENPTIPVSEEATYLCRTWQVEGIGIEVSGDATYGKYFPGANLADMAAEAAKHIEIDMTTLKNLKSIEAIEFTPYGTFSVIYGGNKTDIGVWSWRDTGRHQITWMWTDESMGNDLVGKGKAVGTATAQFNGNKCDLIIDANIANNDKHYKGTVTFRMYD